MIKSRTGAMITMSNQRLEDESALRTAAMHLTGKSRAYLLELEALEREIRLFGEDDPRTVAILDALHQTTTDKTLGIGSIGHLEREATKLLRSLNY
ncbi:MAG: hypothetical protein ACREP9_03125 [Candidatus Dormibacteraceae bacterium]